MKKSDILNSVDTLNSYIATARAAVATERQEARKNTLSLIANLSSLLIFKYKVNPKDIKKSDTTDISNKLARKFLIESIYTNLEVSRSDYMKITAAVYVANKIKGLVKVDNIQEECLKFVECYESVNDLLLESGAKKAGNGAGKRKEEQNKTTNTDTDTDTESKKPLFEKASESLANIAKLLTKAKKEELTEEFFAMLESNITNIQAEIKRCKAKKNFSYKTSQKAA